MAISNTNKPLILPLLAFITSFLMLLNGVKGDLTDLHFKFDSFDPSTSEIDLIGDAVISSKRAIELTQKDADGTPLYLSVGRALYVNELQLWDKTTGEVASFKTEFTFALTSPDKAKPAHGLAFLIAPTVLAGDIPYNSTRGYLGLFRPETAENPTANKIVAVEFDTHSDPEWDPSYTHVGIDVNTINSTASAPWARKAGQIATVRITYNSANGRLNVYSFYPTGVAYQVSAIVDLKTILPERVKIGFSAATGDKDELQTHDILSWSFNSPPQSSEAKEEKKKKKKKQYIARYVL